MQATGLRGPQRAAARLVAVLGLALGLLAVPGPAGAAQSTPGAAVPSRAPALEGLNLFFPPLSPSAHVAPAPAGQTCNSQLGLRIEAPGRPGRELRVWLRDFQSPPQQFVAQAPSGRDTRYCLPEADYAVFATDGHAQAGPVYLTADGSGSVHALRLAPAWAPDARRLAAWSRPLDASGTWLRAAFSKAAVLGIGENSHGAANTLGALQAALTAGAAPAIDWLALEIDAYAARRLTRLLAAPPSARAGTSDTVQALKQLPEWPYATAETFGLLRAHAGRRAGRPLRIVGLNADAPYPVHQALVRLAEGAGCRSLREGNEAWALFGRQYQTLLAAVSQQAEVLAAAAGEAARRLSPAQCPGLRGADAEEAAFLVAYLQRFVKEKASAQPADAREQGMAEVVLAAHAAQGQRCCGLVVAHNGHIARQVGAGEVTMGQILAQRLGPAYRAVLSVFGQGSVRVFHPRQGLTTVAIHNLGFPGLEQALSLHGHGHGERYIDSQGLRAPGTGPAASVFRNVGGFFFPESGALQVYGVVLPNDLNGLLYFPRISPSTPLVSSGASR